MTETAKKPQKTDKASGSSSGAGKGSGSGTLVKEPGNKNTKVPGSQGPGTEKKPAQKKVAGPKAKKNEVWSLKIVDGKNQVPPKSLLQGAKFDMLAELVYTLKGKEIKKENRPKDPKGRYVWKVAPGSEGKIKIEAGNKEYKAKLAVEAAAEGKAEVICTHEPPPAAPDATPAPAAPPAATATEAEPARRGSWAIDIIKPGDIAVSIGRKGGVGAMGFISRGNVELEATVTPAGLAGIKYRWECKAPLEIEGDNNKPTVKIKATLPASTSDVVTREVKCTVTVGGSRDGKVEVNVLNARLQFATDNPGNDSGFVPAENLKFLDKHRSVTARVSGLAPGLSVGWNVEPQNEDSGPKDFPFTVDKKGDDAKTSRATFEPRWGRFISYKVTATILRESEVLSELSRTIKNEAAMEFAGRPAEASNRSLAATFVAAGKFRPLVEGPELCAKLTKIPKGATVAWRATAEGADSGTVEPADGREELYRFRYARENRMGKVAYKITATVSRDGNLGEITETIEDQCRLELAGADNQWVQATALRPPVGVGAKVKAHLMPVPRADIAWEVKRKDPPTSVVTPSESRPDQTFEFTLPVPGGPEAENIVHVVTARVPGGAGGSTAATSAEITWLSTPPKTLNAIVLGLIPSYPENTHFYNQTKELAATGYDGVTQDLHYRKDSGEAYSILNREKGAGPGRCHCVGITFEVWWRALEIASGARQGQFRILKKDGSELKSGEVTDIIKGWYINHGDLRIGVAYIADPQYGLGERILRLEDAQAGDFVQLWRGEGTTSNGHACIFLDRVYDGGKLVGLKYWTSNGSGSEGAGIEPARIERFDKLARGASNGTQQPSRQPQITLLKENEIYIARAYIPGFSVPR